MAQNFPSIAINGYIDEGILDLQSRDNAVLTCFSGNNAPGSPFENLVWNDTHNKILKWYHSNSWENVIDYKTQYMTTTILSSNYQPINSILTNYSTNNVSTNGFLTTNGTWIPISTYFLTKMRSLDDIKNNLGLKSLAYKSSPVSPTDIANSTISMNKLESEISTTPIFKVGDCIPSFNKGTKKGCIKLSKSSASVYTIGSASSNSTYKGNVYKNLFQFIWTELDLPIYASNGSKLKNKGSTWTADWNANKQLELPHIDLPESDAPKEVTITSGINVKYTINKSGYYYLALVGGGGGAAASSAGTWGHQSACSGASGAGFKGEILLNKGDVLTYTIGAGGARGNYRYDWGWPPSTGSVGGDSVIKLNGSNLLTCGGGGGAEAGWARYSWNTPTGGSVTVHQLNKFSNTTSVKGADGVGTSSSNLQSVTGPFNTNYGRGGDAQAWGDNSKPTIGNGYAGYLNLKFLAPKEYGTSNSSVKNELDKMYNSITYFMKY